MKWTWDKFGISDPPPYGIDPERAVLCCMLLHPTSCDAVSSLISERNFSRTFHRMLFRHIKRLYDLHNAIDMLELWTAVRESAECGDTFAVADLVDVCTCAATPEHAEFFARRIMLNSN